MKNAKHIEQYNDTIARLYPELHPAPENQEELNKLKKIAHGKDRHLTREVTFQVTDRCSLACTYCYQINKGKRRMSFDVAKRFVDLLLSGDKGFKDYVNIEFSPAIVLDFIGGEPFLEVDLIDQVCDYFMDRAIELHHPWAKNFMISICSNGVAYFEPKVQAFLEKWRSRLSFSITIDGDKELHDKCRVFPDGSPSYDIAIAGAKDWMNKGYYMGSKITIAPANVTYVGRALKHMIELGYDDINCNCVYEEGWNVELSQEIFRQLKDAIDYLYDNKIEDDIYISMLSMEHMGPKKPDDLQTHCGGLGADMLAVDPDGWLYPCLRYMESSVGTDVPAVRIGNVYEGICQQEKYQKIICDMCAITRRTYNTDECFYCPIGDGCGDCAAYNYQSSGSFNHRATFICETHKARVLATAYYWGRYYQLHEPNKKFIVYMPEDWIKALISEDDYNLMKSIPNIEWKYTTWEQIKEMCDNNTLDEFIGDDIHKLYCRNC